MQTLNRIHFLTENYSTLQGLKSLPFWSVMLAFGLSLFLSAGESRLYAYAMLLLLVTGALAPFAYLLIVQYYRRYGYVKVRPNRDEALTTLVLFAAVWFDSVQALTISLFALMAALYCLYLWHEAPDLRPYYLFLAALMLLTMFLPGAVPENQRLSIVLMMTCIVNIVGTLLDHFLFLRLMSHPQDAVHAESI